MKVVDALWGTFELPSFLDKLLMSPEFRRLSDIRLININSPSLASLSETRRYSHTLGVLRLALTNPMLGFGVEEHKAVLAAIILHDVGTPAFAHLFEYFLKDRFEWSHESVVPDLITGRIEPDSIATQIYYSQQPKFKKLCVEAGIDFDLVLEILRKRHPSSKLIFGSLDYDNIDNVARMNWMLGERVDLDRLKQLASQLGASDRPELELPIEQEGNLQYWIEIRKKAYDVLVFDPPTVAAQAVLSRAIKICLDEDRLNLQDWTYNDTELIAALRNSSVRVKKIIDHDLVGELPNLHLCCQILDVNHRLFRMSRDAVVALLEEFLKLRRKDGRVYGYSFRDKGTFQKKITAWDAGARSMWSVGKTSDSLVVYGFCSYAPSRAPELVGQEFVDWAS
jgi:HD superfamily phosphohydrolase